MSAKLIKGKEIAEQIRAEIKQKVDKLKAEKAVTPGLVTILVGENPASQSYVRAKQKTAHDLGYHSIQENMAADTSQEDLLVMVAKYNADPAIHGILVQLPLPKHIDEAQVLNAIDPDKDVDGFHPTNVGRMVVGEPAFLPCTPYGVQQMLIRSGVETAGAEVVIVGRSNIVGKPLAIMLMQKAQGANATVTVCHTRTKNMAAHTKQADILIVAAGVINAVTADMLSRGRW